MNWEITAVIRSLASLGVLAVRLISPNARSISLNSRSTSLGTSWRLSTGMTYCMARATVIQRVQLMFKATAAF